MPVNPRQAAKHLAVDKSGYPNEAEWSKVQEEVSVILENCMTVRDLIEELSSIQNKDAPVVVEIVQRSFDDGAMALAGSYVLAVSELAHETGQGDEVVRVHLAGCEPGALDIFDKSYLEIDEAEDDGGKEPN